MINNDYDEAIINSNFGLGETVVEGTVTPDCFIINKVSKNIIDKKLGKKEIKIMKEIKDEKNVFIKKYSNNETKNTFSLNDEEILLILKELINIENSYQFPVDIEFGIENNILYILQARPITTYNKLPDELMTLPNEQRILYFDETLGLEGLEQNISILGSELYYFKMRYDIITRDYHPEPKDADFFSYYGRNIQNISQLMSTISA